MKIQIIHLQKQNTLQLFFFLLLLFTGFYSMSQSKELRGRILNAETKKPFAGLKVKLYYFDSTSVETITNLNGYFRFSLIPYTIDSAVIKIESHSQPTYPVSFKNTTAKLGKIYLQANDIEKDSLVPIISYHDNQLKHLANGFITNPDANLQDLALKIPGIVEIDNTLYAQGEALQEVMIDFWVFFTDNNDVVLKNFPADFADTVKVYDDISIQMFATGFDDDEAAKAIDFIPKPSYRKSLFGTAYAGLGSDSRYNMGVNMNYFNGDRRFSVIQQINNINSLAYSPYNFNNALGENDANDFSNQPSDASLLNYVGSMNDFVVDQDQGINKNTAFGISYFDATEDPTTLLFGNYFFNQTDNVTKGQATRNYFSNVSKNQTYLEQSQSNSQNINHRFRAKVFWFIRPKTSLRLSARFYQQETEGEYNTQAQIIDTTAFTTQASNQSFVDMTASKMQLDIDFLHAFKKPRRTFTINMTPVYIRKKGNWTLHSDLYAETLPIDSINTKNNYIQDLGTLVGDVLYTEPINSRTTLLFGYLINGQIAKANKEAEIQNGISFIRAFENDTSIDNIMNTHFVDNSLKAMIQFTGTNWRLNPGLTYQYSIRESQSNILESSSGNKGYFLPAAYFVYSISDFINLKINYKTYTVLPSVEQLQNVIDMSNPLNFSFGNIELEPSLNSLLNIRYTQLINGISHFYIYVKGLYTNNYLGTQNFTQNVSLGQLGQDSASVFISRPVNLNKFYNAQAYIHYSTLFSALQSQFSVGLSGKYYHIPAMDVSQSFFSNQSSLSLGASLSSDITENIDFLISSTTGYNYVLATLPGSQVSRYLKQNTLLKINFLLFEGLLLSSDILHRYNYTQDNGFNQNDFLWNASVGYKFLKDRSMEVRFTVHDILNKNKNTQHNVTNYYIEDIQTNNLQRYFMLSLVYRLNVNNLKGID